MFLNAGGYLVNPVGLSPSGAGNVYFADGNTVYVDPNSGAAATVLAGIQMINPGDSIVAMSLDSGLLKVLSGGGYLWSVTTGGVVTFVGQVTSQLTSSLGFVAAAGALVASTPTVVLTGAIGSQVPVALARPSAVATDGTSVFALTRGTFSLGGSDAAVYKFPIGGGAAASIATAATPNLGDGMAVDSVRVFWSDAGGLHRCDKAAGANRVDNASLGSMGARLAADGAGGNLYMSTGGSILKISTTFGAGTAPSTVTTTGPIVKQLAVDNTYVYAIEASSLGCRVSRNAL